MTGLSRALSAFAGCILFLGCSSGDKTGNQDALIPENETEAAGLANVPRPAATIADSADAKVPGTDYHATSEVLCSIDGTVPSRSCFAGVKRKWGEDGTTLVEITKPDGYKRAIFFQGAEAYSADSAESDGSAGFTFTATKEGDESVISYGPETYRIPDALVVGG